MSFYSKGIVVAGVAFAGLAMAACAPSATVPANTSPATAGSPVTGISSAPPGSTSAKPESAVFGPDGFGKLKIGMKLADAVATGQIDAKSSSPAGTSCGVHDLVGYPKSGVYVSPKLGLATVFAPAGVRTPEGIAEGDSIDKVKQAYPALVKNPNAYIVAEPGGANTQYVFQVDNAATDVVSSMSLVVQGQDCFG